MVLLHLLLHYRENPSDFGTTSTAHQGDHIKFAPCKSEHIKCTFQLHKTIKMCIYPGFLYLSGGFIRFLWGLLIIGYDA